MVAMLELWATEVHWIHQMCEPSVWIIVSLGRRDGSEVRKFEVVSVAGPAYALRGSSTECEAEVK